VLPKETRSAWGLTEDLFAPEAERRLPENQGDVEMADASKDEDSGSMEGSPKRPRLESDGTSDLKRVAILLQMDEAYNTPHDFMMRGGMSEEEQEQERQRMESLLKEFVQMGLTSSPAAVAIGVAWREAAEGTKWLGGPKPKAELYTTSDKEKGGSNNSSKDPNPVPQMACGR
jgi:hypothetical protein